ncbi:hypothetical protein [Botrimarina mediterranea]|uniref:hypothetical protein n=1 Tax=Botrimarina mediterranea TaxID=2528022 RepID=UPI00118C13BD|nr:hypothetical protein K2D_06390 [Planctomycetes bacterium K2D]
MEWATVEELHLGRKAAEQGIEVLRLVNMDHYKEVFNQPQCDFDEKREDNVRKVEWFAKVALKPFLNLVDCGPKHEWMPFGDPPPPGYLITERILRTIERVCPAKLVYPFGMQHEGDGPEEDFRPAYLNVHHAMLRWAHDVAAPFMIDGSEDLEDWVKRTCDSEQERAFAIELTGFYDIDFGEWTFESLEAAVVNEWRLALDFVAKQSDGLFSTIIERANDSDRDILQALVELEREGRVPATSAEIAKAAGRSEQKTKEATGSLYRFGLLDRGPNGTGYRLSEVGTRVATEVGTSVGTD